MIGSLGNVAFEVSNRRVRTFGNMQRSGSARYAEHVPIGAKPVVEFLGPGIDSLSLSINLNARMKVNPMEELQRLRRYRDTGEVISFFLGEDVIGDYVIEGISEGFREVDRMGRVVILDLDLTLKEAVR